MNNRYVIIAVVVLSVLGITSVAGAANNNDPKTKCATGAIVRGSGGIKEVMAYYILPASSTYKIEAKLMGVPLDTVLKNNKAKKKDKDKKLEKGTVICGSSLRPKAKR